MLSCCLPQSWYKEANKNFMPTGYSLPHDTPLIKQVKKNTIVTSDVSSFTVFKHPNYQSNYPILLTAV